MKDTAYFVPPAKIERLAHAYRGEGDRLVLFDEPATGKWSRPPTFEHGATALSGLKTAREVRLRSLRELRRDSLRLQCVRTSQSGEETDDDSPA